MKLTTLCYPIRDGKVLLAMKKRGFGIGKLNGPGGKVQEGESPEQACRREFFEETNCGLTVLEHRGLIEFVFPDKPEMDQACHIFVTRELEGEPQETEEMAPAWYPIQALPLDQMWEDDQYWLPGVLAGGRVSMRFEFTEQGQLIGYREI
jgi:8-oxo-dGTP diphosphatase